jgi:tetratricopeptide (TPR) repeat protein
MREGTAAARGGKPRIDDAIDFGDVPPAVNEILQQGVALHRHDRAAADARFRAALALDPTALPTWFCLYKIHTYAGDLDAALEAAEGGLRAAARQANLTPDWTVWRRDEIPANDAGRFALYTLKALAFIRLRRAEPNEAARVLDHLARLDPQDAVGGSVVAAIAAGSAP